jgi:hypothetical protein
MWHSLLETLSPGKEFFHEAGVSDFFLGMFCFP